MTKLPFFAAKKSTPKGATKREPQPFSQQTLQKAPRIAGATVTESVCPYCAVGCGLHVYTKGGKTFRFLKVPMHIRQADIVHAQLFGGLYKFKVGKIPKTKRMNAKGLMNHDVFLRGSLRKALLLV